jgi:hypothetical protein
VELCNSKRLCLNDTPSEAALLDHRLELAR